MAPYTAIATCNEGCQRLDACRPIYPVTAFGASHCGLRALPRAPPASAPAARAPAPAAARRRGRSRGGHGLRGGGQLRVLPLAQGGVRIYQPLMRPGHQLAAIVNAVVAAATAAAGARRSSRPLAAAVALSPLKLPPPLTSQSSRMTSRSSAVAAESSTAVSSRGAAQHAANRGEQALSATPRRSGRHCINQVLQPAPWPWRVSRRPRPPPHPPPVRGGPVLQPTPALPRVSSRRRPLVVRPIPTLTATRGRPSRPVPNAPTPWQTESAPYRRRRRGVGQPAAAHGPLYMLYAVLML